MGHSSQSQLSQSSRPTTSPAAQEAARADLLHLARTASSPFEHAVVAAIRATYWKASSNTHGRPDRAALAAGVAIEIERRCRVFETPVTVTLCRGRVAPSPATDEFVAESPIVQDGPVPVPEWANTSTNHAWVEVNGPGSDEQVFVDPSIPPQVSGQPGDDTRARPSIHRMSGPSDRPAAYSVRESVHTPFDSAETPSVPWDLGTTTWPFGTPDPVPAIPCDGGSEVNVSSNTVIEMDARDGLAHLPADSVDLIITSPPYRLQRNYPGAGAVWDADPDCDHCWETEELYTDTPIRREGGAGFNSSDDPAELRRDRWRESTTCTECGAWKGQLGLEPTLEEYIDHLVTIFEHAKRVLKPTGSLWVNISDSYADGHRTDDGEFRDAPSKALAGVPPKFELAMREAGWRPRERCAWVKPSPTPDPAHDRRTPAWEHVYRFTLSEQYTDATESSDVNVFSLDTANGETDHSAPMPRSLPEEIISTTFPDEEHGVVVDPFAGSGTVLEAAAAAGHDYLGFEISGEAAAMARDRLQKYDHEGRTLTGQASLMSFQ